MCNTPLVEQKQKGGLATGCFEFSSKEARGPISFDIGVNMHDSTSPSPLKGCLLRIRCIAGSGCQDLDNQGPIILALNQSAIFHWYRSCF